MGLNPAAPEHPHPRDDLAVYALDAVHADEALAIETRLATDASDAAYAATLRDAAGEYAAAEPSVDAEPTIDLRDRVLARAFAERAPSPVEGASPRDVHLVELERFELLARRLSSAQWALPLDPPEFAGWTVRDLVSHVTSNEALFAQLLGAPLAVPETRNANDDRTHEVLARHRSLTTDEILDELHDAIAAVDGAVRDLREAELERDLDWWGTPMRVRTVLVHRSFETWTHADDIRRAIGATQLAPPAPALRTMSSTASGWTALMVASTGNDHSGRSAVLHLTGPGGGSYHVDLGFDERDLLGVAPDVEVTLDVVDYCRAIGDRAPADAIRYQAKGDLDLARDLVASLNSLAVL